MIFNIFLGLTIISITITSFIVIKGKKIAKNGNSQSKRGIIDKAED